MELEMPGFAGMWLMMLLGGGDGGVRQKNLDRP